MAATAKPLVLDRPFRTGFRFGLGLLAAWAVAVVVMWVGSLLLGGGVLVASILGLGAASHVAASSDTVEAGE
ncbi:MAG: hypothetical protein R3F34_12585 [Planctomycetota bacterium]